MKIQNMTDNWLYITTKDGSVFSLGDDKINNNWKLSQYKKDGWKQLITPIYPAGIRWRTIDHFKTKQDAIEYLKEWKGR